MSSLKRGNRRRGVLILIVLSVLVMFGLMAITFLLITGQAKRTALVHGRSEQYFEPPDRLTHEAAMVLLRGSNSAGCAAAPHSLLEDIYGAVISDRVLSVNPVPPPPATPTLLEIEMPEPQLRVGCWLWILSASNGLLVGQSRQITGFRVQHNPPAHTTCQYFAQLAPFIDSSGNPIAPAAGDRFAVVNASWTGVMAQNPSATPPYQINSVYGQMIDFTAIAPPPEAPDLPRRLPSEEMANVLGCVLTMLDGPAAGRSTRIVNYYPATNTLRIVAFDGVDTATFVNYTQLNPTGYIISGAPYSGTGAGFDPTTGRLTLLTPPLPNVPPWWPNAPLALQPNAPENRYTPGGANEDYDAPDYENMFLALAVPDPATPGQSLVPSPSFHRPELVNYWYAALVATPFPIAGFNWDPSWNDVQKWKAVLQPSPPYLTDANIRDRILAVKRRILLRPLPDDNYVDVNGNGQWDPITEPCFTGSNPFSRPDLSAVTTLPALLNPPYYWEAFGPWDVDADGSGVLNAIWTDFGFPVRSMPDGRLVKPLVAVKIVDLDGRVNLNAHGSFAQWPSEYDPVSGQQFRGPFAGTLTPTGASTPLSLPRGQGYGPADVRLAKVVTDPTQLHDLLFGNGAIDGRYGEVGRALVPQAGVTDSVVDAVGRLGLIKHFEFPANYLDVLTGGVLDPTKLTSFGSPPDLWGRGVFGLDFAGQPYYTRPTTINGSSTFNGQPVNWWTNEVLNNPYRLNLSQKGGRTGAPTGAQVDNPFTPAELERVLRPFDGDAGTLAQRLAALSPDLWKVRDRVTTDSFDVPVPGGSIRMPASFPPPFGGRARSVVDLLQTRLMVPPPFGGGLTLQQAQQQIPNLLSWDLLRNRRMDVNRPLGSARDINGNGSVDEVQESGLAMAWAGLFPGVPAPVPFWLTNGFDVNGDGVVNAADQVLARQLMARHLFVLAMLLYDSGYIAPTTPGTVDDTSLTPAEKAELTVRRIAQWAINVVDFRDADSAMTPFEYVLEPFTKQASANWCWNVDGDISTDETQLVPSDPRYNLGRRLVWGCEAPELLLTETLAFHDRRVADTDWDTTHAKRTDDKDKNSEPDDKTLDQPLIPQGSAFVELYCAHDPKNPVAPGDLYNWVIDPGTNRWKWVLDLGRLAPDLRDSSGKVLVPQYPVWRLAISASKLDATDGGANNDVLTRLQQRPQSTSLEPKQYRASAPRYSAFSLLPKLPTDPGFENVQIDRIVWFTTLLTPTPQHKDADRIYYNRTGVNPLLPCGEYALVGPRPVTAIGFEQWNPGDPKFGTPSKHVISLNPVGVVNNDGSPGTPDTTTTIKPATGIIVGADLPQSPKPWNPKALTGYIGLSISEPLPGAYYPEPTQPNSNNGGMIEGYVNVQNGQSASPVLDDPLDSQVGMPLKDQNLLMTHTELNYKTAFLQRLADPNRPYHEVVNPYLTVDWMPIDLTVFNGLDRKPPSTPIPGNQQWDPDDPNPDADSPKPFFSPRQRGPAAYDGSTNVWSAITNPPPETTNSGANLNFRHNLGGAPVSGVVNQTLGYVNQGYGKPWSNDPTVNKPAAPVFPFPPPPPPIPLIDYRGTPCALTPNPDPTDPARIANPRPFPWLTWNNRPFATALELMLVPSSHPGRLTSEFSLAASDNPYDPAATTIQSLPFSHLVDFFHSLNTGGGPTPPHFYRLLDYLEVPSRFVGTDLVLNPHPNLFGHNPTLGTPPPEKVGHLPPFNTLSNYRDPGRVNINAITSPDVWAAVLNGHAGPNFDQLTASRRGYAAANPWDLDPNYPTRFANPFRTAASADLVPDLLSGVALLRNKPVNVTLLRAGYPGNPWDPDNCRSPLLTGPLPRGQDYQHTDRNPFFAYQGLERLGNLVTTRSNVFAVWITVGYFQVQPCPQRVNPGGTPWNAAQYQAVYPDGYALGPEVGADTGEIKRHRAFYIIDRSIPVGFQRGLDLNAEKAIVLKRYIE